MQFVAITKGECQRKADNLQTEKESLGQPKMPENCFYLFVRFVRCSKHKFSYHGQSLEEHFMLTIEIYSE